jgi:uncharacterized membrane protein YciS (DUF1049 family)
MIAFNLSSVVTRMFVIKFKCGVLVCCYFGIDYRLGDSNFSVIILSNAINFHINKIKIRGPRENNVL